MAIMPISVDQESVKILQDVDQTITVMHSAAMWLLDSGKKPSQWWLPQNMNREFLLKHAEPLNHPNL